MSLKGKIVVVYGSSGIIGSGIVRSALREGATVVVNSRNSSSFEKLKEYEKEYSENLYTFESESTLEGITKFKEFVYEKFKRVDHLYSSVGGWQEKPMMTEISEEELKESFDLYFFGHWRIAKVFLPSMKNHESTYTIITGGAGNFVVSLTSTHVTVCVSALFGLVKSLHKECEGTKTKIHELRITKMIKREEDLKNPQFEHSHLVIGKLAIRIANENLEQLVINYSSEFDENQKF
eukprot:TRINITY_DN8462_c0_g1_i2.p1 TRINITY_DN8462_c0_g1~~TRINITY_DN8462_c0_g1_i2.p1  ORF type:complete len:236 (-),score=66.26 TRINITY_DN8462_c0_g1_i2:27-734(-)